MTDPSIAGNAPRGIDYQEAEIPLRNEAVPYSEPKECPLPGRRCHYLAISIWLLVWHDVLLWLDEYNWNLPSIHESKPTKVVQ